MRVREWFLITLASCAQAGAPVTQGDDDVDPPDASIPVDGPPGDSTCQSTMWYRDADQDMHGDPATGMSSCAQPAGMIAVGDDCDDNNGGRHPGAAEVCDGIDTDCSAAAEPCPASCTPVRRPAPDDAKVYLFCSGLQSWASARSTCAAGGFQLVQIESAAENAWVYNQLTARFGGDDFHIGANDAGAEGAWMWDGGAQFWTGEWDGGPVGGRYANWESSEPNDDGTEDCAEMRSGGQWNDDSCDDGQRFACSK